MFRCVPDKEFFCLVLSYFNIKPDMRIVSHGSSDSLTVSKGLRDLQCVFPRGFLRRAWRDYSHVCIQKLFNGFGTAASNLINICIQFVRCNFTKNTSLVRYHVDHPLGDDDKLFVAIEY